MTTVTNSVGANEGHSFAGYLSACYAERSDLRANLASLVLASPVGVGSWRPEHAESEAEQASRLSALEEQFEERIS